MPLGQILYHNSFYSQYCTFIWQALGGCFNTFGSLIPGLAGISAGMAGALGSLLGGDGDSTLGGVFSASDGGLEGAGKVIGGTLGNDLKGLGTGAGVIGSIFDTGGAGEIIGSILGGAAGTDIGAGYGAAAGTVILPGVGTIIGGIIGGAIGASVGGGLGGWAGSNFDPSDNENYVDSGGVKYGR